MNINPITFGKKILGQTSVYNMNTRKETEFNFVEYEDTDEDRTKVEDAVNEWVEYGLNNYYMLDDIEYNFLSNSTGKYYGTEDKNGNIQSLAEVKTISKKGKKKILDLKYMMTRPENAHGSFNRNYAGIGKATFRELVRIAKDKDYNAIKMVDKSEGFWDDFPCFCDQVGSEIKVLDSDRYEQCLDYLA